MLVIGLTGGIGSGKSTVADLFAQKGIAIIDADLAARVITNPDQPAFTKIVTHFGDEVLNPDGTLNRTHLRNIIFSNIKERAWLERLLHPLIREQMEKELSEAKSPYCIAVIPLLLEVEFYFFINRILVVDTEEETQINRVMTRDKVGRNDVEVVLNSQANREHRRSKAHDVISNDGDMVHLKNQVDELHEKYLKLSRE